MDAEFPAPSLSWGLQMLVNLGEWHLLPVSDEKLHDPNNDVLVGIACEVAMRSKV
jgi:hypothetical protein